LLSPYNVIEVQSGYEFSTDHAVTYYVYFTNVSETFGERDCVFSFGFEPKNVDPGADLPKDGRIGDTIARIIEVFFSRHNRVIVYVPYDKDKKDKLRMRLFDIWFAKYQPLLNCPELCKDRVSLVYTEDAYMDVTAIYRAEQAELAQKILFGDLPEIWDASKV
jgi:hypothetical protein